TPSSVQMPPTYSVWSGPVSWMHSMPANLAGWWSATSRAAVSPTKSWIGVAIQAIGSGVKQTSPGRRWRHPGSRQRDQQAEPVQAVAPTAQHPDRVDRGDEEADDHVGGEDHVRHLVVPG